MKTKDLARKITKHIIRLLLCVLVFVYVVVAALNTSIGQSFVAAQASKFFSEEWKTKVRIGAISLTPFINAGIKDIYVEDLQKDTLLKADYIEVKIHSIKSFKNIVLDKVELKDATCHLIKNKGKFNFQFIIDYFSSDKPKQEKKKGEPFVLQVKKVRINDVDFALINNDNQQSVKEGLFSANRMIFKDIVLWADNFVMRGGDFSADIQKMQAKERCGLQLKQLKGFAHYGPKSIELKEAIVQTEDSFLSMDASLKANQRGKYSSFCDSVYCVLNIKDASFVNLKDACYWTERVRGANQKVNITCDVKGMVNDMSIRDFDIQTSSTQINVEGSIYKVTDISNTYFDLNLKNISTSVNDFNSMQLGTMIGTISLPDILNNLGNVSLLGQFKGKLNDFACLLDVDSQIGDLHLNAKAEPIDKRNVKYMADINSARLDIGGLLNNQSFQTTTLDAKAELIGLTPKTMQGKVDAYLKDFYFNSNHYDKIDIAADINGYDIGADLDIKDDSLDFQGKCFVNYQSKPSFGMDAKVKNLNLHKLNFVDFADTNTLIASDIKFQVRNFDINNLNADVEINNVEVKTLAHSFAVDNIHIGMLNEDTLSNNITIRSDILDVDVQGRYTISTIKEDLAYFLNKYIPDFTAVVSSEIEKPKEKTLQKDYLSQSNVDFNCSIKNVDLLSSLFNLNISLPKQVDISGHINPQDFFACKLQATKIEYSGKVFDSLNVSIKTIDEKLVLYLDVDRLQLSDSLGFKDIAIVSQLDSTDIALLARITKMDDSLTHAQIRFNSLINEHGLQGAFTDTYFNVQGIRIDLNDNHIISIANKNISLMNFVVSNGTNSRVTIDGVIAADNEIKCNFENVDLSLLNPFLSASSMTLAGKLNKEIILNNILQSPTFTSNLRIDDLVVNDVALGTAWLNVDNALMSDVFNANIRFLYKTEDKQQVPLQLTGTISPKQEDKQLDLTLKMKDFQLSVIKTFIASFVSDVEGSLSCDNLSVKGKMTSPDIQGVLHTNNVAMKVNMLNTKYKTNDDITIDNNKVSFNNFVLADAQNNKITINGNIVHHNFSSFDIDLKAIADKIKILDTKANSKEMYYGTAYASANMRIFGDSTMINVIGSARTEAGTSLTVPVTSKETAQENNFITFLNDDVLDDTSSLSTKEEKSMGYNISIDLNVNPNAKLYIPMDFSQLKGDLSAAGNGDLKIDINSEGKFSMIGEVAIDNGSFKVNILDFMEKDFILQKGGTLTWNGEPAAGVLDVTAIYKTKTSLSNILGQNYSQSVDVESIIKLSGVMTNPQPSFDINLPDANEQTVEQLFMNIDRSSEKAMLEQTASILLTNQFYSSQGGYENDAIQTGVASSVMGAALSQLSGVVNNMIKFVDVGLNYTNGGDNQFSSAQWGVNLSKSFGKFNLSVNSSFGGTGNEYTTSQSSNIIGDMSATYRYNEHLTFQVFNHSNANDFIKYSISPYTRGAGFIYTRDYDRFADIFKRKKKTNQTNQTNQNDASKPIDKEDSLNTKNSVN